MWEALGWGNESPMCQQWRVRLQDLHVSIGCAEMPKVPGENRERIRLPSHEMLPMSDRVLLVLYGPSWCQSQEMVSVLSLAQLWTLRQHYTNSGGHDPLCTSSSLALHILRNCPCLSLHCNSFKLLPTLRLQTTGHLEDICVSAQIA